MPMLARLKTYFVEIPRFDDCHDKVQPPTHCYTPNEAMVTGRRAATGSRVGGLRRHGLPGHLRSALVNKIACSAFYTTPATKGRPCSSRSTWEPGALTELIDPFRDERVGYVCGQVRFTGPDGGNLEGAYWRYEMRVREMESELAGVTAGNGAIYAVRASAYIPLDPSGSHDLSFPFALAKRRLTSLYRPLARASAKLVSMLDG